MADFPTAPTVLDQIIGEALEKARADAVKATVENIFGRHGDDSELRKLIRDEVTVMIKEDPEIRARLKARVIEALDAPARRY